MLDLELVRADLIGCCEDAGVSPASFVVFVAGRPRPAGTTPVAYLHPEAQVRRDTVAVFREAGVERVHRHEHTAHRLAVWNELPGIPDVAIGPMLRHEVEHARRWERSGSGFFEADGHLREAVRRAGGVGYAGLPSELEANAVAAAYAARLLSRGGLAELRATPEFADLLAGEPPPDDVVEATLWLLGHRDDWGAGMSDTDRGAYIEAIRADCLRWGLRPDPVLGEGRSGPLIEPAGAG